MPLTLRFVTGVIVREKLSVFERILWRACRGNVFLRRAEIETPLENPTTVCIHVYCIHVYCIHAQIIHVVFVDPYYLHLIFEYRGKWKTKWCSSCSFKVTSSETGSGRSVKGK